MITDAEVEQAAQKYKFKAYVICSAKEHKNLNQVFKTALEISMETRMEEKARLFKLEE